MLDYRTNAKLRVVVANVYREIEREATSPGRIKEKRLKQDEKEKTSEALRSLDAQVKK